MDSNFTIDPGIPGYIYFALAFIAALFFSLKTEKKILSFCIFLFVLAQPVWTKLFTINLSAIGIDLQPNRILLLFLAAYSLFGLLSQKKGKNSAQSPYFAYYLCGYLILVFVALLAHLSEIPAKDIILIPSQIILFLLVFTVLKKYSTEDFQINLTKAIQLLAIVVSILAIYQFFIDSSFLKLCPPRGAFSNFIRSTGSFSAEYELGFFINFAVIVFITQSRSKFLLLLSTPLLITTLLLTFHRLSWVIFFINIAIYIFISKKIKNIAAIGVMICIGVLAINLTSSDNRSDKDRFLQSFKQERLMHDTVTGRFMQYKVALNYLVTHPFGVGGYDTKEYFSLMKKNGMMVDDTTPLAIHNGFLAVGMLYGVFSLLFFILFVFTLPYHFFKKISPQVPSSYFPFFAGILLLFFNISNDFSNFNSYSIIFSAIVCGAYFDPPAVTKEKVIAFS